MNFREYLNILKSFVQNGNCPTINLTMYRDVLDQEINSEISPSKEHLEFAENLEQIAQGHINADSLIIEKKNKDTTLFIPLNEKQPLSYSIFKHYKITAINICFAYNYHTIPLEKPIIFHIKNNEIQIFNMVGCGGLISATQDGLIAKNTCAIGISLELLDEKENHNNAI